MLRVDALSLSLSEPLMTVVVSDETDRRTIVYTWRSKEVHPLPPSWKEALQGEVDDQRARELAKAQGRVIP
jgi:hypothetical protein